MTNLQRLLKLVEANRVREALAGIVYLEVPDKVKSLSNYGGELLHALVRCNVDIDVIMKICSQWQQKGVNKYGFSQATDAALNFLPYDQAKDYLDQFVKMQGMARPHFYAPLIAKTSSFSRIYSLLSNELKQLSSMHPESVFEIFADIIWSKVYPHYDEFFARCVVIGINPHFLINTYIAHCLNSSDLIRIGELLTTSAYNFRADYKLVPYLVTYILNYGIDKGFPIAKSLGSRSLNQTVFNSFLLINASGVLTDSDKGDYKLQSICKHMKRQSLHITPVAGEILVSAYDGTAICSSFYNLIDRRTKFPDEVNAYYFYSTASCSPIETYETQLKLMEKVPGSKLRGIIRKLILAYCNANNQPTSGPNQLVCQRINQLLEKLDGEGESVTPATASVLMSFFAINDDLDKALFYKSKIPNHFNIDLSKILHLAIKMASSGLLNDSINMISEEIRKPSSDQSWKSNRLFTMSYSPESLVRDYLELVADHTRDIELVKKLSDTFLSTGKVKPGNKFLRPRVKVHLDCHDLQGAFDEFIYCVQTFKKTPGQSFLVDYLIERKMFDKLESLINFIGQHFDKTDIIFTCTTRLVVKGYLDVGQNLINKMNPDVELEKKSIYNLILHNLAKENISACIALIKFYRKKIDLKEREHLYNRIYSLSLISNDLNSMEKILHLMKEEKIEPNIDDTISTKNERK